MTKQKMRMWHIPQVPGTPFHVNVKTQREALLVLNALADYDAFQLEHNIKPDYANAQGLEVCDGEEWIEWEDSMGRDINEVRRAQVPA